jgi:hypothetical protein
VERKSNLSRFAGVQPAGEILSGAKDLRNRWCREGESNPHRAFAPADFKSAASANFAIPARNYSSLPFRSPSASARTRHQQPQPLDLLTEVGMHGERAVIVQLLVTSPAHGIAHSLDLNLRFQLQSFPIGNVWKHELRLPNLAG